MLLACRKYCSRTPFTLASCGDCKRLLVVSMWGSQHSQRAMLLPPVLKCLQRLLCRHCLSLFHIITPPLLPLSSLHVISTSFHERPRCSIAYCSCLHSIGGSLENRVRTWVDRASRSLIVVVVCSTWRDAISELHRR